MVNISKLIPRLNTSSQREQVMIQEFESQVVPPNYQLRQTLGPKSGEKKERWKKKTKKFGRKKKKLLKLNGESLANRRKEVNVPSCASMQQSFVFIGPGARLFQDVFRPFIWPAIRHCPRVPGFLRNFPDPRARFGTQQHDESS